MAIIDLNEVLNSPDKPPTWLVRDTLAAGNMIILAGEPGVGKSILAYTLAMAVATGEPFLGRQTTQGPVLYYDEENSLPDMKEYLRWVWRGLEKPSLFDALRANLSLAHFELAAAGPRRYDYMRDLAADRHPSLIILDTASPVCNIQQENDNAEAGRAIVQLRRVQAASGPGATMLILKHEKLDREPGMHRTIRGAKTWLGELDAVLFHVADRGRPRKDGLRPSAIEPDKVRAFGLRETLHLQPIWTADKGLKLTVKSG